MTLTGSSIAGRYTLRSKLGEGGMATIYRAWDSHLEREVAVKMLRPQYGSDADFVARFRQEARSAGSLSHPNIVSVHDFGTDADTQFIVMELVEGRDLASILRERGKLWISESVLIAEQVAAGLEAAHRRGIVHRDVKPGNILLTDDGHVRVADFGIARAASEAGLTTTGTTLGSVHYFSPEQARGQDVTPASDVYSLGIVLYEMLTGRRPFEADSSAGVALMRLTEDPVPPSVHEPSLPRDLVWLVMRALQRDPKARFPNGGAFREALRTWQPPAAAPARAPAPAPAKPSETSHADGGHPDGPAPVALAVAAGTATARDGDARPADRDATAVDIATASPGGGPAPDSETIVGDRAVTPPPMVPEAVAPAAPPAPAAAAVAPQPRTRPARRAESPRRRAAWGWVPLGILALAVLLGVGYLGSRVLSGGAPTGSPTTSMVGVIVEDTVELPPLEGVTEEEARAAIERAGLEVGDVSEAPSETVRRGRVVTTDPPPGAELERGDTVDLVVSRGPEPTAEPTPEPTAEPETETVQPTPAPVAVATPAPVAPQPEPDDEPAAPAAAQSRDPAETIALWYELVENEEFDAAYALWSPNMKANYPRQENLDNRWSGTAEVRMEQLYVAQQSDTYAAVQANFTEVYEDGSSVRRVGWWDLMMGPDGWLLEAPHY